MEPARSHTDVRPNEQLEELPLRLHLGNDVRVTLVFFSRTKHRDASLGDDSEQRHVDPQPADRRCARAERVAELGVRHSRDQAWSRNRELSTRGDTKRRQERDCGAIHRTFKHAASTSDFRAVTARMASPVAIARKRRSSDTKAGTPPLTPRCTLDILQDACAVVRCETSDLE